MAETGRPPRGAHLVGSFPLSSADEVFRTASEALGRHVRRIPDGETGDRSSWIVWQLGVLQAQPQFETVPPAPGSYTGMPRVTLRPGVRPAEIAFGPLGYAACALDSYQRFARLKEAGVVPAHCRFQVCLPPPLAPVTAHVLPEHVGVVEPPYEARMLAELDEILAA